MSSLGRYEIHGEIAAGGMARVHFGRLRGDQGFQRVVALKRMHPKLARDPKFVAMFRDEALLASRIRHPNVVPTLDVVSDGAGVVIVMEYVRGLPLSTLLALAGKASQPVPVPVAVSILCDVLAGLHAAHEARSAEGEPLSIVHRDVSPQNILVDVDGVARVMDFGIAKASSQLHVTMEGEIKGKLAFMAPEQILSRAVDRRVDVFAAGVVFYSMLLGRPLFARGEVDEVRERVLTMPIEPLAVARPDAGEAVSRVIAKALQRDRDDRYETARDFELALEAACERPATARQLGAWVESLGNEALLRRDEQVARIEASAPVVEADEHEVSLEMTATDAPTIDLQEARLVGAAEPTRSESSGEGETTGPSVVSDVTPGRRLGPRIVVVGALAVVAGSAIWLAKAPPQTNAVGPARSAVLSPNASAASTPAVVVSEARPSAVVSAETSANDVASAPSASAAPSTSARRKLPGYFPARP